MQEAKTAEELARVQEQQKQSENFTMIPAEPEKPSQGCGPIEPINIQTDTAHRPVPKTAEKIRNEQFLQAQKYGGKNNQKPQCSVEPQKGTPEWKKQHPHGEYKDAKYHTPQGNSKKSPCPKDGQAALDRSFGVEGTTQRVATEDGKIVILKDEGNGVFHGYLVDDFHSIKDEDVKKTLIDNELVRSMKSGKIIK